MQETDHPLQQTELHIVSFDVPWPANYGGVIDVFYKLRTLHRAGIGIHLHCYQSGRAPAQELERYCRTVRYYPRKTGLGAALGLRPYIVAGRMSDELVRNLASDNLPILLEGLHTCGILSDPRLKGRFMIYRESNIEHHYYRHLAGAEKNPGRKLYFLMESLKLKRFQQILSHASLMLTVSQEDTVYLQQAFPEKQVVYLPSFHRDDEPAILPGRGDYALYHGNLKVPENLAAAQFLVNEIWEPRFPRLVVAGLDPPEQLVRLAAGKENIEIIAGPDDTAMFTLIREAHINILVTFQATGLKLKLLNALFNGRFCLVNPAMVAGTGLGEVCTVGLDADELKNHIGQLFQKNFTEEESARRRALLLQNYSNERNGKVLADLLTGRP